MKAPRTVRDVPASVYLPALAELLKKLNLFQFRRVNVSPLLRAQFELWFYGQVAVLVHKLYLIPSMYPVQFASTEKSSSKELRTYLQALTRSAMCLLLQRGLLIRDKTGIFFVSERFGEHMDALVSEITI
jgi:hypothetical protein